MAAEPVHFGAAAVTAAGSRAEPRIRQSVPEDLAALVALCVAHAAYERAGPVAAVEGSRLR